jgi:hypothetical protein
MYGYTILDFSTSWRLVVVSRPGLFIPSILDRSLNGSQNRSGRREEEKNINCTGTQTVTPWSISWKSLYRLRCYSNAINVPSSIQLIC